MVRMAQPFSLRAPLVDGHGNFGSLDGDSAAAYRYTEARLKPLAIELLSEIRKKTVDWRPNFDGVHFEPVVLPGALPEPPRQRRDGHRGRHGDVDPAAQPRRGARRGDRGRRRPRRRTRCASSRARTSRRAGSSSPDKRELRAIYESGQGTLKLRGEWEVEEGARGAQTIVVTSIPYAQEKAALVAKIADVIIERRLPALVDVRDESTDDVRIVLEIKRDADPALVMTYLYKHTPLETTVPVNLTCLVPTAKPDVGEPARLSLAAILRHFLDFRFETVRRRFVFDLEELKRRIHLLEGFVIIYDALDEAIRIIRKSDGKADAAGKLMKRFGLDEEQVEAILETKLYKLARLEIDAIRAELKEKQAEAAIIEAILKSPKKLWNEVKGELGEVRETLAGEKRRTKVSASVEEPKYDAEAFIQHEDAFAVVSVDGWLKRQRELKDPKSTRLREGDEVLAVLQGSTKERGVLFSNHGAAYVLRLNDVPPSTGYGEPVQKLFKFGDGERVVAALSLDPRVTRRRTSLLLAATRRGLVLRFSLDPFREVTTRAGRRFARPAKGDEIASRLRLRGEGPRGPRVREGAGDPVPGERGPRPRGAGQGRPRLQARAGRPPRRRGALRRRREARDAHARERQGHRAHDHEAVHARLARRQGLRAHQARPAREGAPARDSFS